MLPPLPPRRPVFVETCDEEVIAWARQHGLRYYYVAETELPGGGLKIHLGYLTAYFLSGKLVRLWVHADGAYLDEVIHQLEQLLDFCVQIGGYVEQEPFLSIGRGTGNS